MNNKLRVFFTKLLLWLVMDNPLVVSSIRRKVLILCGAKIGKNTFIGQNVYFDPLAIQNIEIGDECFITQNCSLLTHFYSTDGSFSFSNIKIGNKVFLGMNSIICKPITIGDNSVIGAGSIVTHDIPCNSFACGSPCKVQKAINK